MFQRREVYTLLLIAVAVLHFILSKPITNLDKGFSDLQFELRGQVETDSSIVTLYIDNAIMDSLGRVPLKWIYYARIIDALSSLGVKAIGIDIVFDENSPDYPTQASWLVTAIKNSGRVCVGGFFDKINHLNNPDSIKKASLLSLEISSIINNDTSKLLLGENLELPFPWLLRNAAGFGHLNFEEDISIRKVPLVLTNTDSSYSFLKSGELIPALTIELLRINFGLPKDSLMVENKNFIIKNGDSTITIPTDDSQMLINYCGDAGSLNMVSISDFLNMYYSDDGKPVPELNRFKDKIVLIGLTGNRISQFASTPFDNKFPFIGIHANIIDTILRQRFLYKTPSWVTILISLAAASLIFWFITSKRLGLRKSALISGIFVPAYFAIAFIFFNLNIIFPVEPAIIIVLAIIYSSVYRFNSILMHSKIIEKEKHCIESILSKSREKIMRLEETLTKYKNGSINDSQSTSLTGYHAELSNLTTKFEDLSAYNENKTDKKSEFQGMIYKKNGKMEYVINFTKKIAPTDATVLILGESGTGKELIAKAIHNLSERKNNNFITINCGAIPETLLESELFGHEEGSYTGAHKRHKGYFETADKGTIFLDEITETSELFQTKLLRVLQSGEFNRVGGNETIRVNVRFIAASNKDIENLVGENKFRKDLYYRLNVIKISIPSLRSRKTDIPILIKHFFEKEDAGHLNVSNSVMEAFALYNWPGNIRQLENVIKRVAILAKVENRNLIQIKELPAEIIGTLKNKFDIEEQVIDKLRQKEFSHNSISDTASELGGLHRGTVVEYFRGVCFREFCEHQFDIEGAAVSIAGTEDEEILAKVKSKMEEYLNNLHRNIDKETPLEQLKEKLNIKYKKLPNRYHNHLEEIINHYYNKTNGNR